MGTSTVYEGAKRLYVSAKDRSESAMSRLVAPSTKVAEGELATWSTGSSVPLSQRVRLLRRGYLSRDAIMYDLENYRLSQYLSDYQRELTAKINEPLDVTLDNKLVFHWMMRPFDEHRQEVYGLLRNGRLYHVDELEPVSPEQIAVTNEGYSVDAAESAEGRAEERILDLLRSEGTLVMKPIDGSAGDGVVFCSYEGGDISVNGEPRSKREFERIVRDQDDVLVCEFVEQAEYAEKLFDGAANTLRILTMWDEEADESFIPMAVQRIGSEESAPVDNWAKGGVNAEVDTETGELGEAVQYPNTGELEWHSTHPDTGAQIQGVTVEGWSKLREKLLEMAAEFSYVPYIGWDVIVTDEGEFTVIEANNCSGVTVFQTHRPLLADRRVEEFYRGHGVL